MVGYVILKESLPIHPTTVMFHAVRAPAYEGLVKRNGLPGRVPPVTGNRSWGGTTGFANLVKDDKVLIGFPVRFWPGVKIQESKPRTPIPGFQRLESKARKDSKPRTPNLGIQTQESKPRNAIPGIQPQESNLRNPNPGI